MLAACKNGHSDAHIGAVRLLCRHGAERRGLVDGVGCSAEAVCRHFGHQQLLDWICQSRGWSVLSKDVVRAAEDEDYEARQAELARVAAEEAAREARLASGEGDGEETEGICGITAAVIRPSARLIRQRFLADHDFMRV